MRYSHRYRAYPSWTDTTSECETHLNIARQLYNHIRYDYTNSPDDNKPSEYTQNNRLPEWKQQWSQFTTLHSKVAQEVTSRFHRNLSNLHKKKQNGGKVGWIRHKPKGEYTRVLHIVKAVSNWKTTMTVMATIISNSPKSVPFQSDITENCQNTLVSNKLL